MSLTIGVATFHWPGWGRCVRSWGSHAMFPRPLKIVEGKRITDAYQEIYQSAREPIIGYIHDDVVCLERDWDARIVQEFLDPKVGLVGLGGAKRHGSPDLYRTPYVVSQLARGDFMSNLREAEVHGKRFEGECDVAVLDGFALFVRREVLARAGGWLTSGNVGYFMYSEWLCCMARRLGYRIRLVGLACDHLGGRSTGLSPNLQPDYEGEHAFIYSEFKDVLPAEVQ